MEDHEKAELGKGGVITSTTYSPTATAFAQARWRESHPSSSSSPRLSQISDLLRWRTLSLLLRRRRVKGLLVLLVCFVFWCTLGSRGFATYCGLDIWFGRGLY